MLPESGGDPLNYNAATRVFTAESDATSLIETNNGVYPISVEASFTDYNKIDNPSVSTKEKTSLIRFNSQCVAPTKFYAVGVV